MFELIKDLSLKINNYIRGNKMPAIEKTVVNTQEFNLPRKNNTLARIKVINFSDGSQAAEVLKD